MKVVHLLRKFDPAEWGGTEMAMQRLFDGLRHHDVEPVVYCPRLSHNGVDDPLVRSGYQVQRFKAFVPVIGLTAQRRRQLVAVGGNLMSFDLIPSLWREQEVDLIHTHTLGRIGGIALTIAKQRKLPCVLTIHGGVFDLPEKVKQSFNAPLDHGWEWGKLFGLLFQSHKLLRDVDAIVTCNGREADQLKERFPEKRVWVQPHGVPVEIYEQDHREAARLAYPQLEGKEILLSLGRVDPIKNQHWLIEQASEIFKHYPQSMIVLVGACTDEPYGQKINQMIRERGLVGRVLLTGGMASDDPRLLGLLQLARVLLLPSLSETFGLVLLEAWAAGTSVMASQTSGAKALIEQGSNGWLFDLEQPETFHKALRATLSNPNLTQCMVDRGRKKVKADYSINTLAGRMKQLYQEIIEEKQCVT